jgi:hypothetical protein
LQGAVHRKGGAGKPDEIAHAQRHSGPEDFQHHQIAVAQMVV